MLKERTVGGLRFGRLHVAVDSGPRPGRSRSKVIEFLHITGVSFKTDYLEACH